MRTEFAKLLKQIKKANPDIDEKLIRKAYSVADQAHQGQMRLSGAPYINHCLEVAGILTGMGMDSSTITASLLHDVIEDTDVTFGDLEKEFGTDIARLVDGVTKIGTMPRAEVQPTDEEKQAANLRKMLVATAQDIRVILIKLADRLHNLRTIEYLPEQKIKKICQETLDIYVPIANRMSLSNIQWELEDHAFHHLHPVEYKETAKAVAMKRSERETLLKKQIHFIEERLKEAEVTARVIGRPKHLYSIYQKMEKQGKTYDEVQDVMAIRIITQTVSGCYNALGVIHHLWPPVPGRFKDYIARPKINMYQSIHTTVTLEGNRPFEAQIRTEEMDRTSREGIAAHWKYKDLIADSDDTSNKQLLWLQQMQDWLKDAHAPDELFDSLRRDISTFAVFVNTPRGEVKELPQGATPIDFAYSIHSDVGHHCIGAKVNGHLVPLRYHLQNGDTIEILTSKNQNPHMDWLDIVVSGRARTRIRQRLRDMDELPDLNRSSKGESRSVNGPRRSNPVQKPRIKEVDEKTRRQMIRIEGQKGMATNIAKCCNPMPGEPVIGYLTKRHSISIHRADCRLLEKKENDTERIVGASWEGDELIESTLLVHIGSRPNVLADITNAIRPMNIEIIHAEFRPDKNGESVFEFQFETTDRQRIDRVSRAILNVSGVRRVSESAETDVAVGN
jgi:GTP pyrophosphokinase